LKRVIKGYASNIINVLLNVYCWFFSVCDYWLYIIKMFCWV